MSNINYTKINSLNLNSSSIGDNINTRFANIDNNFNKIATSEYLKGAQGDSIFTKEVQLTDGLLGTFSRLITGEEISSERPEGYAINEQLKNKTITQIYSPDNKLLSILPFVFKDNIISNLELLKKHQDLSCIIYYDHEKEQYQKIHSFPTIYYNEKKGLFYWKINGTETDLVAQGPQGPQGPQGTQEGPQGPQGPQGKKGEQGQGLLIASCDYNSSDNIPIKHFYYYKASTDAWDWIDVTDKDNLSKIPLIENSVVFAKDDNEGNEIYWYCGLLHIQENNYYFKQDVSLNNIIGTAGANLFDLMKKNKFLFLPTNPTNIVSSQGHIITVDDNNDLIIGPCDDASKDGYTNTIDPNNKLTLNYKNVTITGNLEIKGELPGVVITGSKKLVNSDGKTDTNIGDSSKPVYFADGVPVECGVIESSSKLDIGNIGSSNKPVYFANGIPVECEGELAFDITGNAESANVAKNASKATSAEFAETSKKADEAEKSGEAEKAKQLFRIDDSNKSILITGNSKKPVYFKDGIPVECTEDLDINITGNAESANVAKKIETPVTISVSGIASSTPTEFDGSKNINIPLNNIDENGVVWNDCHDENINTEINPIDFASCNHLNVNRLSFIPADDITVEYSNDGNTWSTYDLTDFEKQSLVTSGFSQELYLGNNKKIQQSNLDRLRITITAPKNGMLCDARKLLIHTKQNNIKQCAVELDTLSIGQDNIGSNFEHINSYDITNETDSYGHWNSIPLGFKFGGLDTDNKNIRKISITIYFKKETNKLRCSCIVDNIFLYGELINDYGHELAKSGNMYTYDVYQNTLLKNNLKVEKTLQADSLEANNLDLDTIKINTIQPDSNASTLGSEDNPWMNIFTNNIFASNINSNIINADTSNIKHAKIETANISNIINDNISILPKLPIPTDGYEFNDVINHEVENIEEFYEINADPGDGKIIIHEPEQCEITIKTSKIYLTDEHISISVPNLYIPIGLTYTNDYGINALGSKKWANIHISNITATLDITGLAEPKQITVSLPDYTLPCHKDYHSQRRNGAIYYASLPLLDIEDLILTPNDEGIYNKGYNDCKIQLKKISYVLSRDNDGVYKKPDRTNISYSYIFGLYVGDSTEIVQNYFETEEFNTDIPTKMSVVATNDLSNPGEIYGKYIAKRKHNKLYLASNGIHIVDGYSKFTLVTPSDYHDRPDDNFGYMELYIYDDKYPGKSITKKKSLLDIFKDHDNTIYWD